VLEKYLQERGIRTKRLSYTKGKKSIKTLFHIWRILLKWKPDVVHTHLRYGTLLGIPAAALAGVPMRFHTRHHSSFHHEYHTHAVKSDRFLNRLSTGIVSISDVVSEILIEWEGSPARKVKKIHHGFDLEDFSAPSNYRVDQLRKKYALNQKTPVIGMISRYIEWKGCEYGIDAFSTILESLPNAHLILANASGPYQEVIREHLVQLPEDSYTEIKFEEDIAALYSLFDVFVHVPINAHIEAFGQTYVEALAAKVPSVFTLSGVSREFISHEVNALVVPFKDAKVIAESVMRILSDSKLSEKLTEKGKDSISIFELDLFLDKLAELYES